MRLYNLEQFSTTATKPVTTTVTTIAIETAIANANTIETVSTIAITISAVTASATANVYKTG